MGMVTIRSVLKGIASIPSKIIEGERRAREMQRRAKIQSNVAPLVLAGTAGALYGARNLIKRIPQATKVAYQTVKSAQSMTLKKRLGLAGIAGGAYTLGQYATTGSFPKPSMRTLAGITAFQLNPFAGIAGGLHGAGERGVEAGAKLFNKLFKDEGIQKGPMSPYIPGLENVYSRDNFPTINYPEINQGDFVLNFPETPSLQSPVGSLSPSLSISGGFGGGGFDYATLLALLGAMGLGGYALGRRKRKKKKYKKRRN